MEATVNNVQPSLDDIDGTLVVNLDSEEEFTPIPVTIDMFRGQFIVNRTFVLSGYGGPPFTVEAGSSLLVCADLDCIGGAFTFNWHEIDLSWKVKDSNGVWHRFVVGVGYREDDSSDGDGIVGNNSSQIKKILSESTSRMLSDYVGIMSWRENEVSDVIDMFRQLAERVIDNASCWLDKTPDYDVKDVVTIEQVEQAIDQVEVQTLVDRMRTDLSLYEKLNQLWRRGFKCNHAQSLHDKFYNFLMNRTIGGNEEFTKLLFDSLYHTFNGSLCIDRLFVWGAETVSIDEPTYMHDNLFFPMPRTIGQFKEMLPLSVRTRKSLERMTASDACVNIKTTFARLRAKWYFWHYVRQFARVRSIAFYWREKAYSYERNRKEDLENVQKELGLVVEIPPVPERPQKRAREENTESNESNGDNDDSANKRYKSTD